MAMGTPLPCGHGPTGIAGLTPPPGSLLGELAGLCVMLSGPNCIRSGMRGSRADDLCRSSLNGCCSLFRGIFSPPPQARRFPGPGFLAWLLSRLQEDNMVIRVLFNLTILWILFR